MWNYSDFAVYQSGLFIIHLLKTKQEIYKTSRRTAWEISFTAIQTSRSDSPVVTCNLHVNQKGTKNLTHDIQETSTPILRGIASTQKTKIYFHPKNENRVRNVLKKKSTKDDRG